MFVKTVHDDERTYNPGVFPKEVHSTKYLKFCSIFIPSSSRNHLGHPISSIDAEVFLLAWESKEATPMPPQEIRPY